MEEQSRVVGRLRELSHLQVGNRSAAVDHSHMIAALSTAVTSGIESAGHLLLHNIGMLHNQELIKD